MIHTRLALLLTLLPIGALAAGPPRLQAAGSTIQLTVDGKPFLILGGELGNSSAGTAAQADTILPAMARLHLNTVLMPVAWEQVEPEEGRFDFQILDHWIDTARRHNLRLVLLWFGSWKNAFSEYAPAWVKADPRRFPRARDAAGAPLEILSTFGAETRRLDARAFAALITFLRDKDQAQQTVLMVQVENEMGYLGPGRDRAPEADRAFSGPVLPALLQHLTAHRADLTPELRAHFQPQGATWQQVFGEAANEVFMAWHYASYVQTIAEAGKRIYPLPLFVNAQLPAFLERPGAYPSGGPHPYYLDVYRAAAPALDFYAPDIYWPEFEYWVQRYQHPGNAIFIPEARLDAAPYNALYAYGAAAAIGFCPFGIDSVRPTEPQPVIAQTYEALASIQDLLLPAQRDGRTRALVLRPTSPRGAQTVSLGGYLFEAALNRAWRTNELLATDGALLLLETQPGEFLAIGTGLTVRITRDPDTDTHVAGIASIEEVTRAGAGWTVKARLNGDQSNQGRQLTMDSKAVRIYRLRLYHAPR